MKKIGLAIFGLVAFAISAAAEPFYHEFNEWREYHQHWLAVCPVYKGEYDIAGKACWATTYSGPKAGFGRRNQVRVFRDKDTGEQSIEFAVLWSDWDSSQDMVLRFQGGETYELGQDRISADPQVANTYNVSDPALVSELLNLMKRKNFMYLHMPLVGEPIETAPYSLMGFSDANQFLADFAQGNPKAR